MNEEISLFTGWLQEMHHYLRPHYLQWYSRKSRSAPHVHDPYFAVRKGPEVEEGIKEMFYDDILIFFYRGQIICLVPFLQLSEVGREGFHLLAGICER